MTTTEKKPENAEDYFKLVNQIVDRVKLNLPSHINRDDLFSVGLMGLNSALNKFDDTKECTFRSYASMRIRGAILDELRRMDTCPRRARARIRLIKQARNTIEQKNLRAATHKEVQEELNVTTEEYRKWMLTSQPHVFVNLDQPVESAYGNDTLVHECIVDENSPNGRDAMEIEESSGIFSEEIDSLEEIPRKVIAMYYFQDMRFYQIAEFFGLTESRICQIHAQAVKDLRKKLKKKITLK